RRRACAPCTYCDRNERAAARDGGDRALGQLQPRPSDLVPADDGRSRQALPARAVMAGVMLITGGSRGIGAATARLAVQRGYKVALNYVHNKAAAEKLAREIGALAIPADVEAEADVMRMFAEV